MTETDMRWYSIKEHRCTLYSDDPVDTGLTERDDSLTVLVDWSNFFHYTRSLILSTTEWLGRHSSPTWVFSSFGRSYGSYGSYRKGAGEGVCWLAVVQGDVK
jgi:hypothetical protein